MQHVIGCVYRLKPKQLLLISSLWLCWIFKYFYCTSFLTFAPIGTENVTSKLRTAWVLNIFLSIHGKHNVPYIPNSIQYTDGTLQFHFTSGIYVLIS